MHRLSVQTRQIRAPASFIHIAIQNMDRIYFLILKEYHV